MRRSLGVVLACAVALAGCGGHHKTHPAHPPTLRAITGQQQYQTPFGPAAHSPTFGLPPRGITPVPPTLSRPAPTADMFDSVSLGALAGLPSFAWAGYTAGLWPTFLPLTRAYPQAHVVSIAIGVRWHARCLDVEPGDASPSQAAAWVIADRAAGFSVPCLYASLSDMPAVRANLAAHGIARTSVFLWDADWTFVRHLDSGFDATQWTDHYLGRNVDASVVTLAFLGIQPAPAPKPVPRPARVDPLAVFVHSAFPSPWGKLDERFTAAQYLGAIAHPATYRTYLHSLLHAKLLWLEQRDAWVGLNVYHSWKPYRIGSRRAWLENFATKSAHA